MTSRLLAFSLLALSLIGCSNAAKMRAQEREKLSLNSGLYCDFVNGDEYADIEVQLNLEMAKRCDANRNFTLTSYKNASEIHGLVYCCALPKKEAPAPKAAEPVAHHEAPAAPAAPAVKPPTPAPASTTAATPAAPAAKPAAPAQAPAPAAKEAAKPAPASEKKPAQVINSGDDLLE